MQLTLTTSYLATGFGLTGIANSLATAQISGTLRLFVSSQDGRQLATISLAGVTLADASWPRDSGTDFAWQHIAGLPRLFSLAGFGTPVSYDITATASGTPTLITTPMADLCAMQVLDYASGDLAVTARRGAAGLDLFHLSDRGGLTPITQIRDGAKTYLDGVTDTAILQRGADRLLLTISPLENGLTSHRIAADGSVEWLDSFGPREGLAVNGLSMLQTARLGGTDFAIVAATLSSSLTVLRVNPMGVFFATDMMIDDRSTRFAHLAAFDTFTAQGRLFVVAAGTDSGISLLEILPDGRLSHIDSFSLEGAQGPRAVTAIKAEVIGKSLAIMLVDARADRVLHYGLALDSLGIRIDAVAGQALGDGLDNRLIGGAGAETLSGGGGADYLHDGGGADLLTGGAGADVFVLARDGVADRVTDFTQGQDRLDLGDWGRVYSIQGLTMTPTQTGAVVDFGAEHLIVTSVSGTSLTLTDSDFLF